MLYLQLHNVTLQYNAITIDVLIVDVLIVDALTVDVLTVHRNM